MNAVEIEEAISALAEQPFDPAEFPYAFLQAFSNKDTTIKGSVALAENATICSSNLCNMSTTCCVQSRLMQQIQRRPAHRTAASAAQAATAPHATPGPPGAATEPAVRSTHEHRRPARPAPEIAAGCVSSRPATRATRAGASRAAPDPPRGAPPWSPPAYGSASTRVVAPRNPNRRRGPYCTPIRGFRSGAD